MIEFREKLSGLQNQYICYVGAGFSFYLSCLSLVCWVQPGYTEWIIIPVPFSYLDTWRIFGTSVGTALLVSDNLSHNQSYVLEKHDSLACYFAKYFFFTRGLRVTFEIFILDYIKSCRKQIQCSRIVILESSFNTSLSFHNQWNSLLEKQSLPVYLYPNIKPSPGASNLRNVTRISTIARVLAVFQTRNHRKKFCNDWHFG